jgi:NAD(P)-dependent dehydrogenase (short-subunit alcohol dehydrogenase family)
MFAPDTLEGRVGLVTGAGSPYGIGRSLVIELAKAGAKAVYACDLNQSNFPSLIEQIKGMGLKCQVVGKPLDVSSEEQTVSLLREILKEQGRFDFFFANAGYANFRYALAQMLQNMSLCIDFWQPLGRPQRRQL